MDAHTVLVKARNLIADEKNWHQGWLYDTDGHSVCAIGAVLRAHGLHVGPEMSPAGWNPTRPGLPELTCAMGIPCPEEIAEFNDSHSYAEVLAAFDAAIAATAPSPDLSFLKDVRAEPERVA